MTKDEENLIIAEQNKSTEEILKAVAKVKADYHELCKLKDMRITELEKENAELRTKTTALENANRAMIKELDEMTSGGVSVLENVVRSKEQLTKAKEIITKLVEGIRIISDLKICLTDVDTFVSEAEQFLKDV